MPSTRLPVLLLSLLSERPMHGYDLSQEIDKKSVRQWANVGLSSIYQTLDRLHQDGYLAVSNETSDGQGFRQRLVYSITSAGREHLAASLRKGLQDTEHQRFDYDLSVGVGLMHLPLSEVRVALENRLIHIQKQAQGAAEACHYAESQLGAWAVLDHQRRALEAEAAWLEAVIRRLSAEGGIQHE